MTNEFSTIEKLKQQLTGGKHWTSLTGQARKEYLKLCRRERMALLKPYTGVIIDPNLYKNQFVKD